MEQNSNASKRRWQAAAFGCAGLFLLVAALQIVFTVPCFDPFGKLLDAERMEATITTLPLQYDSQSSLVINLETGSIYRKSTSSDAGVAATYPTENKRVVFARILDGTPLFPEYPYRYSLVSIDGTNNETAPAFEFPASPTWLTDSVLVGVNNSTVYSIDASSNVRSELLLGSKGRQSRIMRIPNSRRFVSVTADVLSFTRSGGQTHFANIFEVDGTGQLKLLQTIELQDEYSIGMLDGKICYIKPDARAVTMLDPDDLSLLSELSIPSESIERIDTFQKANAGTCSITLRDQVVSILFQNQEHCHFLLPEMKRVVTTDKLTYAVSIKGNESLLALGVYEQDLVGIKMIDLTNMRELWSRKLGDLQGFEQRDGQLIFTTAQYGFTADVLDVQSGEVLIHRAPFAWLTWMLPILLLGSVGWSWQLIRWCQHNGAWNWGLAASLSVLLVGVLASHLKYWGCEWTWDSLVIPQYLQGYFVAALSVACAWIVWGKGRWLFRCLPLFLVIVMLIGFARWILKQPSMAANAVGPTLAMASLALPLFCIMRWCGFGKDSRSTVSLNAEWRVPLRDLFIISTLIAALLAVALPLAPGIRFDSFRPQFIVECLSAEGLLLLGFSWAATCYFKRWDAASFTTLLVLIAMISLEALYPFVTGQPFFLRRSELPMVLFRIVSSSTLLFGILLHGCLGDAKQLDDKLSDFANLAIQTGVQPNRK